MQGTWLHVPSECSDFVAKVEIDEGVVVIPGLMLAFSIISTSINQRGVSLIHFFTTNVNQPHQHGLHF